MYQVLAPGDLLFENIFVYLHHLILLCELGEGFVLDHVGDLVTGVGTLHTALLPLPGSLDNVLKVSVGVWVESVEPQGGFTLHFSLIML